MARTIDERIVQMTFKNEEFEQRARQTITTLSNLKKAGDSLSGGDWLANLGKNLAGAGLQSLTVTTTKISEGFSALEQIAVGALRNIGAQAVNTGKRLIDSLTVDQLRKGWEKYTDQTQSVQTLVNSTGKSVSEIDSYLEKLMWYSDETSFGFTDMTKALSTMVSSGGDINKLIPMIEGIGNATAYAGKGASEFQRVIYNLNQSYSSGFLNTMDWRSIELAGVDSKALKEQLIAVGKELGTIKDKSKGLSDFKELLSDKVFTRDVMEKAFSNFAELTEEAYRLVDAGEFELAADAIEYLSGKYSDIAESSFVAAQSAKSFQEAIDATKDAVSSGWMQTFKLIFGNYEESKALWTDVTESMWNWFASGAEKRNDIFKSWKQIWTDQIAMQNALEKDAAKNSGLVFDNQEFIDLADSLTQTQALWRAFSDAIDRVIADISDVWNSIFPIEVKDAAQAIFNAIESVREALNNFAENAQDSAIYSGLLKGFEAVLKVLQYLGRVGRELIDSFIAPLGEQLKPIVNDLADIFSNLFDVISNGTDHDLGPFRGILEGLVSIFTPIINGIGAIIHAIKEWSDTLNNNNLEEGTEKMSLFQRVLESISKVIQFIAKALNGTINIFSKIGELLGKLGEKLKGVIGNFLASSGTDVSKLAEGGFLAYIVIGLTKLVNKLKKLDLQKVLEGITNFFNKDDGEGGGLVDSIQKTFDTLTSSLQQFSEAIKVEILDTIANCLIKLAAALLILSLVDSDKIGSSLGMLATALGEMLGTMFLLSKMNFDPGSMVLAGKAFSKIATSLIMLALALKIISSIEPDKMKTGLIGLGTALLGIVAFIDLLNLATKKMDPAKIASIGKVFSKISFGLIAIALALKIMSSIDPDRMTTALIGLGVTLAELMGFFVLTSNLLKDDTGVKLIALGKALTNMSVGLIAMSLALKILSTIDGGQMDIALVGLFGALASIAGFAVIISKFTGSGSFVAISAGMLILSVAIAALAVSLKLISKMSWGEIGKGLATLAGSLLIIGGLGALLGIVSPLLLVFAAALGVFGLALTTVADGMTKFIEAYAIFKVLGNDFGLALVDVFEQAALAIIAVIPMFIAGIIEAILKTAKKIVELVVKIIDLVIEAITTVLPKIIEVVISIILAILIAIRDCIADFVALAVEIAINFITGFIEGLNNSLPELVEQLIEFFCTTLDTISEALINNAGKIGESIGKFCSAIIVAIIEGLLMAIVGFAEPLWDLGRKLWNSVMGFFTGSEAQDGNIKAGEDTMRGYENGLTNREPYLHSTAERIGKDTVAELDRSDEARTAGSNTANGFIFAMESHISDAASVGMRFGNAVMMGLNSSLVIKSPSRKTAEAAMYAIAGFVNTINDKVTDVTRSGSKIGDLFMSGLSKSIQLSEDLLQSQLNPVITPVLDLSDIQNNAGLINGMLGSGVSLNAALAADPYNTWNSNFQNGANPYGYGNEINMYNTFEINGVRDMDATQVRNMASMLYSELNELLGNEI